MFSQHVATRPRWRDLAIAGIVMMLVISAPGLARFASSPLIGTADAVGIIPAGEYEGQTFIVHLRGEYSGVGNNTLVSGAGTFVQIGSEVFEGIVGTLGPFNYSLCCGEGYLRSDWPASFDMKGQVLHQTTVPHTHLFAGWAQEDGSYCFNIRNQTGTVVEPPTSPHDPGIGLLCFYGAGATVTIEEAVRTVPIDIKPGSAVNPINLASESVIPVAILSTDQFDATTVDPLTVMFGPGAAVETHGRGHVADVNADGRPDLVFHFATAATGIVAGTTSVSLTGKTFDGAVIQGSDAVLIVR